METLVTFDSIVEVLESKKVVFAVQGDKISVNKMSAIGADIKKSVCYYDGSDPLILQDIEHSIIICKPELPVNNEKKNTYIFTNNPQLCFYYVSYLFEKNAVKIFHDTTSIDKSTIIGTNVSIEPFCFIEECIIGNNVIIESGVKIYKRSIIGNDVRIQSNSVVGACGVMWAWDSQKNKVRCIQTGNVVIEDNVFIGSNITIVKGAFENRPTIIGKNTMIAHGTMIGHGAIIGADNHIANNVTIAGSVQSGKYCFFGSGSSVRPHVVLPEGTIIGTGAVVVKNISKKGLVLAGNPAKELPTKRNKHSGIPSPFSNDA